MKIKSFVRKGRLFSEGVVDFGSVLLLEGERESSIVVVKSVQDGGEEYKVKVTPLLVEMHEALMDVVN